MRSLAFWQMITDLIQTLYGKVIDLANAFIFDIIDFNFLDGGNMIAQQFPFIAKAASIMQALGVVLLIGITVFNLFRGTMGPLTETDKPARLLVRAAIYMGLIYAMPYLISYIVLEPLKLVWDALSAESSGLEYTMKSWMDYFVQKVPQGYSAIDLTLAANIVTLILSISIGFNYFRLILQSLERWVVLYVMFLTMPLAVATGASATTNKIFASWTRMFATTVFLLLMDGIFLVIFSSGLSYKIQNAGAMVNSMNVSILDPKNVEWIWSLMALAILRTGLRLENYLSSLGLNVAQSGAGLMGEIGGSVGGLMLAARAGSRVAKGVSHTAKNMIGNVQSRRDSAFQSDTKLQREGNTERIRTMMPNMQKAGIVSDGASIVGNVRQRSDGTLRFMTEKPGDGSVMHSVYNDYKKALEENPDGSFAKFEGADKKTYFVSNVQQDGIVAKNYDSFVQRFGDDFVQAYMPEMDGKVTGVETGAGGAITLHSSEGYTQTLYPTATHNLLDNGQQMNVVQSNDGRTYYKDNTKRYDMSQYEKCYGDYAVNRNNPTASASYRKSINSLESQLGLDAGSIKDYRVVPVGQSRALEYVDKNGDTKFVATRGAVSGKGTATPNGIGTIYNGSVETSRFNDYAVTPVQKIGNTKAEKVQMKESLTNAGKRALGLIPDIVQTGTKEKTH